MNAKLLMALAASLCVGVVAGCSKEEVKEAADAGVEAVQQAGDAVEKKVDDMELDEKAEDLKDDVKGAAEDAKDGIKDFAGKAAGKLKDLSEAAANKAEELEDELKK